VLVTMPCELRADAPVAPALCIRTALIVIHDASGFIASYDFGVHPGAGYV